MTDSKQTKDPLAVTPAGAVDLEEQELDTAAGGTKPDNGVKLELKAPTAGGRR